MLISISLNAIAFCLTSYVGYNAFFKKRLYFMGTFSLVYALLFCFIPVVTNIIIGPAMYHPEAVDGIIDEIRIYNYYGWINFCYSISIVGVYSYIVKKRRRLSENMVKAELCTYDCSLYGVLFICGVLLYVHSAGFNGGGIWQTLKLFVNSGRMAAFANENFSLWWLNVSFYLMAAIAYYACFNDFKKNPVLSCLVFLCLFGLTVLMGGRQFIILALSGLFIRGYYSVKISTGKILVFSVVSLCFLIIWQLLRANIYKSDMAMTADDVGRILSSGDIVYFYYASLEAIRKYLYSDWLYFGATYRNLLFMLVPHDWTFGLKMQDLSIYFADAFVSSPLRAGNYPPGLIGLFVLNFGFWGWFLIGLPFLYMIYIFEFIKRNNLLFMCGGALYLQLVLAFSRGTLMGFYQVVFVAVTVYLLRGLHMEKTFKSYKFERK